MRVEKLTLDHCRRLYHQGVQEFQRPTAHLLVDEAFMTAVLASGPSFAGVVGDQVVGIAGITEERPTDVGLAWAFMAQNSGPHMLTVTRAMRAFFAESPLQRIETMVATDYRTGRRWAWLLGFELETERMRKKGPGGIDLSMWVIIR